MATFTRINHVTLIVRDLDEAARFYEEAFELEPLPAFKFDYPAQFYRINDEQQLHLTEWEDVYSFRGHVCFQVDDFNAVYQRMKAMGRIDTAPWGRVRRLPDGGMQMFIRDPSGNLVEISAPPGQPIDPALFDDEELVEADPGLYVSHRNDDRGLKSEDATLYHGPHNR
ncbi:glyoxalase [Rhodothermaceae bacterium RA]|nr:glyoxalase [Rhodothermaceae bacterium RA]